MKIRVVILAAGKGKRMGSSDRPKVLHAVLGRPMLAYVLDAVVDSGIDARPVLVVGHMAEHVKTVCGDACEYVMQEELKGTGDAVRRARTLLEGDADHLLVLVGDQPFVTSHTLRRVVDRHLASGATLTLGTITVPDFEGWRRPFADFGRIMRDASGRVARIVETKDADPEELAVRELNPAYYCFKAAWLWPRLERLTSANAQGEYYLTDLLKTAIGEGEPVETVPLPPEEALGVNTLEQLAIAEEMMRSREAKRS
jgi:bifunctional UDP-N-acetylglucosamine pyrophosphorylase/glucosamine-1-phosphate N-acetyltransferase